MTSSGSLAASVDYRAWGNPETTGGLSAYTPFEFPGAHTDPRGPSYLIGRYYDPATGQFLSVDPKVQQTLEPYAVSYTHLDVYKRQVLAVRDEPVAQVVGGDRGAGVATIHTTSIAIIDAFVVLSIMRRG